MFPSLSEGLGGDRRYQSPECKYYELTLDNDGAPFTWTSNFQVITKVYLTKHPGLPRAYKLNYQKDAKMTKQAMAKMVAPES